VTWLDKAIFGTDIRAVAQRQVSSAPYDYISVTISSPETLYVWQDGKVIYQSLTNTGIAQAPTAPGTYAVYLRYISATMSGYNPSGSYYDDPGVPYVAYFNGGDAVHGFLRAQYGTRRASDVSSFRTRMLPSCSATTLSARSSMCREPTGRLSTAVPHDRDAEASPRRAICSCSRKARLLGWDAIELVKACSASVTQLLVPARDGEPVLPHVQAHRSWHKGLVTKISVRTQRRKWGGRAGNWDRHNDFGMGKVAAKAIELARARPGMACIDLGCGSGRLALLLAKQGADVVGVDVSEAMIEHMESLASKEGLATVRGLVAPIEQLTMPAGSVDLVITNYALHHLLDADKQRAVRAAFEWLRPGGQLLVADMMLGRGLTARDRRVIAGKLRIMAKKGIPGYWRILKNAWRFILRTHERPITPEAWSRLFQNAGFANVERINVVAEAAIVKRTKPTARTSSYTG
jgi:ubiquinone/menaquinone biosynthesis C-methylase UbiE